MKITAGTTSYILDIFVQDSSSTAGAGLAGLVYNTASLTAKYKRQGSATWTTISLATATAGTWASGGFIAAGSADDGDYELHLPNAVIASGVAWVAVSLQGAANMAPTKIRLGLTATNDQSAADGGITKIATIETSTTTTIPDLVSALTNQPSSAPVERSPNDTNPITFSWPVSGATITAEASLDNAAYGATVGAVTFLRTEGSLHYYSLAFNAADRPTAEGTARYKLADGTYTQYVTLRVEGASTDAAGIRSAVGLASANLDSQLGTILADTNELQLNQGDWATATGFSTHAAADVWTVGARTVTGGTITTLTGHVNQTGDTYALANGASGFVAVDSTVDGIQTDLSNATDGLGALKDLIDALPGGALTGARTISFSVVGPLSAPVENAAIRISRSGFSEVVRTDVLGEATVALDDATYAVAVTAPNFTSLSAQVLVVAANASVEYTLAVSSISLPSDPSLSTGTMLTLDEKGVAEAGVSITVQVVSGAGTAGLGYDQRRWTETSDVNGNVQFVGLVRLATYNLWRGATSTGAVQFTAPDASSFLIAEVLGT